MRVSDGEVNVGATTVRVRQETAICDDDDRKFNKSYDRTIPFEVN